MIHCNIDKDQLNEEWPSIRCECNRAGRTRAFNDTIIGERRLKIQRKLHREHEDSDDEDDDHDIYQQNKKQRKWYTLTHFTQLWVT